MFTERNGGGEPGTVKAGIFFLTCDMSCKGFSKEEMVIFAFVSQLLFSS